VEVFLCGCGYDVVVVGHEDDVVDEKIVFFVGFLQCVKDDAGDLPLVEPEGLIICSTDQVVRIDVLNDS